MKVTLETLRADHEVLLDKLSRREVPIDDCLRSITVIQIAETHGLEAAMLFKLSNGVIDPRKGGDA